MNDTLIALGAASAALAPFAWVLHQRWNFIRPLRNNDVRWRLDTPKASPLLAKRYAAYGEWLSAEWHKQYQTQGAPWRLRATAVQIEQLREAGWGATFEAEDNVLTRNQAMDLLMLAKPPEQEDSELIAFFNIEFEELNALVVSHKAAELRLDSQAMQTWNERPATALQKEAVRYFQGKVPRTITAEAAKASLQEIERGLYQGGRAAEWSTWLRFAETWQHIQAKEVYGSYDIKKPTPARIRDAIQSLLDDNVEEWNERDVVVQRLIERYPDLDMRKSIALA